MKRIGSNIRRSGRLDYLVYMFRLNKFANVARLIGTVGGIWSVYGFIRDNLTITIQITSGTPLIGLAVSFLLLIGPNIIDACSTKSMQVQYTPVFDPQVLSEVHLSKSQEKQGYMIRVCVNGRASYSEEVDRYLQEQPVAIDIDSKRPQRLFKDIRKHVEHPDELLRNNYKLSRLKGAAFFNESKLCLINDFFMDNGRVTCAKGDYYSGYLTNRLWYGCVENNETGATTAILDDDLKPVKGNELKDLGATRLNNQIGGSTLAVTADNYLVISYQNRRVQINAGKINSSGSGSADWSDYRDGDTLQDVVKRTMERELCEEANIQPKNIVRTEIIGYFRWIDFGGQPEFVGITKLNCMLSEVDVSNKEIGQRVNLTRWENREDVLDTVDSLLEKPNLAVPLEMNLAALKRYINAGGGDWILRPSD